MDCDKDFSCSGDGSNFVGAIFMCNRTTKKECFRRKLFGLPMAQAGFVKKVKSGMFLFLFEYERRELYGVFEATTDGAINVVPDAYSKSGSLFPAQVHFKSLWICHPLSENEFRDAIRKNYHAPNKFDFGLSYDQVVELVELFNSKKVNPRNRQTLDFHSNSMSDNDNNVTGRSRSKSFDTTEQCEMNDMNSKSRFGVHLSMCNENPELVLENPNSGIEYRSYPRVATQALHPRNHPYPSYPDSNTYNFPSAYYHEEDSFNEIGVGMPNSVQRLTETQFPHIGGNSYPTKQDLGTFRSHSYPPRQEPVTFSLPCTDNHGLVSTYREDYLPLQAEGYLHFNYDSALSKLYSTDVTDYFHSVHALSNTHGYAETSKEVDSGRGMRYWKMSLDYPNPPLLDDDVPPQIPRRYSSECCDAGCNMEDDHHFPKGSPSANTKLQSEMFQRRPSVFSRLSKAPKSSSSRDRVPDAENQSSSDLLRILSQRKNKWNKMGRVKRSFPRINDDNDTRLKNIDLGEPIDALVASESDEFIEESTELPFFNFKRRSGKIMDEKPEGKCKRRKLIRPSFPEDDPKDNANKDTLALEASHGDGENMSPIDEGKSAKTLVPVGTTGGRIVDSKEGATDVSKANANAERSLVESNAGCLKASVGKIDVNLDNTSNVSNKEEGMAEHTLTAHIKLDGSNPNDFREKNSNSGRNLRQVSHASVINAEDGGMKEHGIVKSDLKYESSKSTIFLDLNSEATCLESDASVSELDPATMKGDDTGLGMKECNNFKSDLRFEGNKSDGFNESAAVFLDLNNEATFLESNANVSNLDSAPTEDGLASKPSLNRAFEKSHEDARKDGSHSDGNRNISPDVGCALATVNHETEPKEYKH